MTNSAIIEGMFAASDVVIDAEGLNLPFHAQLLQPQLGESCLHCRFLLRRVDAQFRGPDDAVVIAIECGDDVGGMRAAVQKRGLQVGQAHGTFVALGILVDPIEGGNQVVGGQQESTIHVGPLQQHRLEARDQ